MIKKTLYFGNPAYLSLKNSQIIIKTPEIENSKTISETTKSESQRSLPIEDIGVVVLDNKQITLTNGLLEFLLDNNCAVITCGDNHLPIGLLLPLCGNTTQNERFRHQIDASLPLKKQLWQQTIKTKIENQAYVLSSFRKVNTGNMFAWANDVKSGDSENLEARAAAYYWSKIFPQIDSFKRDKDGAPPNNLLNYGYAILRAVIARSLVISGLLPTLGIHHHNRYNAYCLADDIMEPYRPFVDKLVIEIIDTEVNIENLTKEIKAKLLKIPVLDVMINDMKSPLMVAASQTTASLAKCFLGESRKIIYPNFVGEI